MYHVPNNNKTYLPQTRSTQNHTQNLPSLDAICAKSQTID